MKNKLPIFKTAVFLCLSLTLSLNEVFAQSLGLNNATPDASSILDMNVPVAPFRGLLIPRMTQADRALIALPARSLMIYQTDNTPGYYYNSNTAAAPVWVRLITTGNAWSTTGNASTTASVSAIGVLANNNFLGTTDAIDFVLTSSGYERMRIASGGNIGIGNIAPNASYLMDFSTNATIGSGVNMTLAGGAGSGINITSASSAYNGMLITNSSAAASLFYGSGSVLSNTNIVSGFQGYRNGAGLSYGIYGINGTTAAYATNASTWAAFLQGRTVISAEGSPTSAVGTDLEVRNTSVSPAQVIVSLRQSALRTASGNILADLNFGDNHQTTPEAQIEIVRGAAGGAGDLPTDIVFSNTPDASAVLTERMRILYDGKVGIGTAATGGPKTSLDVNGAYSARFSSGAPAAAVVIPDDVSLYTLTAAAGGGTANVLSVATPKDGQFLTIINEDDDDGTFGGYTVPATNGICSFLYKSTAPAGWRMMSLVSGTGGSSDWSLEGNSGTTAGTNFVGTTDAKDLVFKTNGTEVFRAKNANGLVIAPLAIATSTSIDIGALSGATTNTGINIGAISGGTLAAGSSTSITTGVLSSISATAYQLNLGAITGANAASHAAIYAGAISGVTPNAFGIIMGTLTGGTASNQGIYFGDISGATLNAYGINLGNISGGTTTTRGIDIGSVSGAGTGSSYGIIESTITGGGGVGSINAGLSMAAIASGGGGTSNTGINIGAISGATTTASGISLTSLTGGTTTNQGLFMGNVTGVATNAYGVNLENISGGTAITKGIDIGTVTANPASTGASYGIFENTITGGGGVGSINAGLSMAAIASGGGGTSNTGINMGAISGATTTSSGISLTSLTGGTTTNQGLFMGNVTGVATNAYGINLENISGGTAITKGIDIGTVTANPASTGVSYGIFENTITGGGGAGSINAGISMAGVASGGGGLSNTGFNMGAVSGATTTATGFSVTSLTGGVTTNQGFYLGNITGALATNAYGINLENISGGTAITKGIDIGTVTATPASVGATFGINQGIVTGGGGAGSTNYGINIAAVASGGGGTLNTGINFGAISGATTTASGISFTSLTGGTTTNQGFYLGNVSGVTTSAYGINLSNVSGGTTRSTAIDIGTVTGTAGSTATAINIGSVAGASTSAYGINLANVSGGTTRSIGVDIGTVTGSGNADVNAIAINTTTGAGNGITNGISVGVVDGGNVAGGSAYGINLSTVSRGKSTTRGIDLGNITGAGGTSYGVRLGTLASGGGTSTLNIGIDLGVISGATVNAYGINLSSITGGTTSNNGIDIGTVSGATQNAYGINLGNVTGGTIITRGIDVGTVTGTTGTATGINIGGVTGGTTTNTGLYVGAVSGATNNYAAVFAGGNIGVGVAAPLAKIEIAAGSATAKTAPLKFNTGPALTVPVNGVMEYTSPNLTFTDGGVRKILMTGLSATANLNYNLGANATQDLTIAMVGAVVGDACFASPAIDFLGCVWSSWVSAADVVTVRVYNNGGAYNPANAAWTVKLIK